MTKLQPLEGAEICSPVTFEWEDENTASWYKLLVDDSSTWETASSICTGGACAATRSLTPGAHEWDVMSWNTGGSAWTGQATNFTVIPVPGAPVLIEATGEVTVGTEVEAVLKWHPVDGAEEYRVYIRLPSGDIYDAWFTAAEAHCGGSEAFCYLDESNVPTPPAMTAGTFTIWLQASGQCGTGPWSPGYEITVVVPRPATPVTLSPQEGDYAGLEPDFSWEHDPAATWYKLKVDGAEEWREASVICGADTCTTTWSTPLAGGPHTWEAAGWNATHGLGDWSSMVNFTASDTLASPDGLTASATSSTQIDLTWNDNSSDETAFHIERSDDGGSTWTEITVLSADSVSYGDTGLTCGTIYHYRLRAYRVSDTSYSAYSNVDSETTGVCTGVLFLEDFNDNDIDHDRPLLANA